MTQLRDTQRRKSLCLLGAGGVVRASKRVCGKSFRGVICTASVNPVHDIHRVPSGLSRRSEGIVVLGKWAGKSFPTAIFRHEDNGKPHEK